MTSLRTKVEYFEKFDTNILTWQEALDNFNFSVANHEEIKIGYPGFFVSHSAHRIENLKPVLEKVDCDVAHLYMNITIIGETFGKHQDEDDVWFWQCQGTTKWTIENISYTLNPGDLIFVPKHMPHAVEPLTPRFGISMSRSRIKLETSDF